MFCDGLFRYGGHHSVDHFLYRLHVHHWCCHGGAKGVVVGVEGWIYIEHGAADNEIACVGVDEVQSSGLKLPRTLGASGSRGENS